MDRRNALKALAAVAGATGLSVVPVTTQDMQGVELVLLKANQILSHETKVHIRDAWLNAVSGTSLEKVKAVVFDPSLDVEFVRTT